MSSTASFALHCILTGAILAALLGLVFVPLFAHLAGRLIAGRLWALQNDPLWQAPLAAIVGAVPGCFFLSIAAGGLIAGWHSSCMEFLAGRVIYAGVASITAALVWRALSKITQELAYIRCLRTASRPASERLAAIAFRAGIHAREIDEPDAVFALVGLIRPVVVASSSVLMRMSDDEIYAALRHEAAHRDRGDGIVALLLLFFSSLLPVRTPLWNLYREAREIAADHIACRRADRLDLAGAITVMARTRCASVPALSGDGTVQTRVYRLVNNQPIAPDFRARSAAVLSLFSVTWLGIAPLAIEALRLISCSGVTPR